MSCGLRDVLSFESAGLPSVLVASSVFEETAAHQAQALGQPDVRRVFVPHPIQDRTDDEMRALAGECVERLVEALGG